MGSALRRLIWRAAAPVYALADRVYRRWHRLEEVGGILLAGRTVWRGARRRLEDGTEIAPGDAILQLHLNGQRVAGDGAGAGSPAATGLRFVRRFVPACRDLARRLSEDPGWHDVVAVHAVGWITPYVGERWGFEFERLPGGLRTWFIRWHMGNLLAAADRQGHRRGRQRPWPMDVWMSRRRLCERFHVELEG
jgi:hypothetical protein